MNQMYRLLSLTIISLINQVMESNMLPVNIIHALDAKRQNMAMGCVQEGMSYSMYVSWLEQLECAWYQGYCIDMSLLKVTEAEYTFIHTMKSSNMVQS